LKKMETGVYVRMAVLKRSIESIKGVYGNEVTYSERQLHSI
jgi:aspartate carbamoyltransferase catalytic subunit